MVLAANAGLTWRFAFVNVDANRGVDAHERQCTCNAERHVSVRPSLGERAGGTHRPARRRRAADPGERGAQATGWNMGSRRPSASSTSHATATRWPQATDSGGQPVMLVSIRYPSSRSISATT